MFDDHNDILPAICNGLIFTTGGYCFSLIWGKQNVYLFDPHSRDKNGLFIPNGSSILITFKSLTDVEKYIRTEYSKHILNFSNTHFDLQYVRVVIETASDYTILSDLRNQK